MMLSVALIFVALCMILCFYLFVRSREAFSRVLLLSLLSSLTVAAIVLWAVRTGEGMYLDVALTFALLGFMDVQFYAVYLRRKGDL